jgi:Leucine-rich repeat (LRR) protein
LSPCVSILDAASNGLKGQLPQELGDLLDLEHISLFQNEISGNLPGRLVACQKMNFIAIESNLLSGPIPAWIRSLPELEYLALGDNALSGELPDFSGMSNLLEVALDGNQLEGGVEVFNDALSLQILYLDHNKFTARIHENTFPRLNDLRIIDLSDNLFVGYFPSHFYNLEEVYLSSNNLNDGELPEVLNPASPMTCLSLFNNSIDMSIPTSIGLLKNLVHLDLSDNDLTGTIPDELNALVNLKSLYLSRNPFTPGPIPKLYSAALLQELSLAGTNRTGTIRYWVGNAFSDLVLLDLHDNALTGPIPTSLGDLDQLKLLFLNRNRLNGNVPAQLSNLTMICEYFSAGIHILIFLYLLMSCLMFVLCFSVFSFVTTATMFLDNNELTGSLEPVCQASPKDLAFFSADCSEVSCNCCKPCCTDAQCNNSDKLERITTMNRNHFLLSENLIFHDVGSNEMQGKP